MVNIGNSTDMNNAPLFSDASDMNGGGAQDDRGIEMKAQHDEKLKTNYTMPGVLHFIQHEWSRFEMERAQWEMEKAELQARISFLQGERKGQENLKLDLVRRIKMLEFALKQERVKNYRLTHNGTDPDPEALGIDETDALDQQVPMDVDAVSNAQANSAVSWKQGRQLLRQYLQEIGYSENILDVRSYRVRALLGLAPGDGQSSGPASEKGADRADGGIQMGHNMAERVLADNEQSVLATTEFLHSTGSNKKVMAVKPHEHDVGSDSDDDGSMTDGRQATAQKRAKNDSNLAQDEEEALNEFDFLAGESGAKGSGSHLDHNQLDKMKNQYRMEAINRIRTHNEKGASGMQDPLGMQKPTPFNSMTNYDKAGSNLFGQELPPVGDIDEALGLSSANSRNVDINIRDEFGDTDEDNALPKKWNLRYTLRNHFDAIRQMQFHPVDPLLCTASEDGTVKLWNLSRTTPDESTKATINDLEPVYTFRGHRGAVLSLVLSPTGDQCYTGGIDGTVRCWTMPSPNLDPFDPFGWLNMPNYNDPSIALEVLRGHHDAIWSVSFHSSDNRLISASADGTLKLWEPGSPEPLLKTYGPPRSDCTPTAVDFVSTEPQQVLVSYYPSSGASLLDLETGKTVVTFDCSTDDGNVSRVTTVAAHPTMPVTVTAGEDKRIRYFDNNTGQLIHGTVAHVEAISSLALDPNGLYLLSGAHDGSLRLWNMEKRVCLQEIAAHRKKLDESVLAVAFHPSRPLIGSAGADGLAKVYS